MEQSRHRITLLTRAGCGACLPARESLEAICSEFEVELTCVDVDEAAAENPDLRAEYGDRLPVVLLDDKEHSYWEVDEDRLRADLAQG
ncbi:glutaredoxin family protein [Rhodococcus sp. PAM 2766]|uniref:Glutaredoxin family protein n=1 Tax=Rhodococcus parequi TaxID=3137122 RepID=A0ABW9FJT8_9NOCA